MTIQPGEFWVADIRFTDGSGSKKRPVLVLWLDGSDAVVAAVSTAAARSRTDVPLTDWRASGLRAASIVRLSRLDCLEQTLLIGRIGAISSSDGHVVKQVWKSYVEPQWSFGNSQRIIYPQRCGRSLTERPRRARWIRGRPSVGGFGGVGDPRRARWRPSPSALETLAEREVSTVRTLARAGRRGGASIMAWRAWSSRKRISLGDRQNSR
jgi:mRNA interferase MazF